MTNDTMQSRMTARASIFPILSVNFVATLGFSIVVPFMVFLVAKWGGNGLMWPTITAQLSRRAGNMYQGAAQGFAGGTGAAASIIGLIGGLLHTWVGPWVFVASAGVIGVISPLTVLTGRLKRP